MGKDVKNEVPQTYMKRILNPWIDIRQKLEKSYMPVSDVLNVLNIKSRQLLYWYLKRANVKVERDQLKWAKYSRLYLFCFGVLVELRKFGLPADVLQHVFSWLKQTAHETPFFIYCFLRGLDLNLCIFVDNNFLLPIVGADDSSIIVKALHDLKDPILIIPLYPILRKVLEETKTDDFHLDSRNEKMTLIVDGKTIGFEFTDKEIYWVGEQYQDFVMSGFLSLGKLDENSYRKKVEDMKKKFPNMKFREPSDA